MGVIHRRIEGVRTQAAEGCFAVGLESFVAGLLSLPELFASELFVSELFDDSLDELSEPFLLEPLLAAVLDDRLSLR